MLKINTFKITGQPSSEGWVQIHEFTPQEETKLTSKGHLVVLIVLKRNLESVASGKQLIDEVSEGRELVSRFQEEYFGKSEVTAFYALKDATEKIASEFSGNWPQMEISATSFVNGAVYSASFGGGQIAILREGSLAKILLSEKHEGGLIKVASASGYPQENDLLLLGSSDFFQKVSETEVKTIFSEYDLQQGVESLTQMIRSLENSSSLGVALINFAQEQIASLETDIKTESQNNPQNQNTEVITNTISQGLLKQNPIVAKIQSNLGKLLSLIKSKLPEKKIYLKKAQNEGFPEENNKKTTFTIAVILMVVLLVSIVFGIRQKKIKDKSRNIDSQVITITGLYQESLNLATVDRVKARELFRQARDKAISLKNQQQDKNEKLESLLKNIQEKEGEILAEYLAEPKSWLDLTMQSSGYTGSDLASSGEEIFVLDSQGKKIIKINLATKKTGMAAGPDQIENAKQIIAYENRFFVVEDQGINELGSIKKPAITKTWGGEVLANAYAANIYLIDKQNNSILRFNGTENGFSSGQNWLAPGITADFSLVKSMAIDGAIWLLTASGKLLKYESGAPRSIPIYQELEGAINIYTNENTKSVYVLNQQKGKIYYFSKTGEYQGVYISSEFEKATDLVVSEEQKKVILLSGTKLNYFEIKHL